MRVALCTSLFISACGGGGGGGGGASAPPASPKPMIIGATLEVEGGTLYYEVAGSDPGVPVVFIHGGFGDRRMWDGQFLHFAADHRVVRYDHRGFGKSSFPDARYSAADDLLRLLDALEIPRAHLVGNSMGAALALDFTLLHPDRVATFTMVASGPNGFPDNPEEETRYQADADSVTSVFAAAAAEGVARGVELWAAHPMIQVAHADPEIGPRVRQMIEESPRLFEIQFWPEGLLDPPAAKRLAEVSTPALIVVGDRDNAYCQAGARAAAAGIAGARLEVLNGVDHLLHMEVVDDFNRLLAEFLARGTGAASR